MLKVKIDIPDRHKAVIEYAFDLFARHIGFDFQWTDENEDIQIGQEGNADADIPISRKFLSMLEQEEFHHEKVFNEAPLIRMESGQADYLGTIFYMVNSLQEYNSMQTDNYGRFPFSASYQAKYDCVEDDLVSDYFDKLFSALPQLSQVEKKRFPTQIFLSHDIDNIHQAVIQDGLFVLKKLRPDKILSFAYNELKRKPNWLTIQKILEVEKKYEAKSTFFWLVNKGKGSNGVPNADYDITNSKIVWQAIKQVEQAGAFNGLHKSAKDESFASEMQKAPFEVNSNRNHFLKISLPEHYEQLHQTNIQLDGSLGFAEKIGFRNSYSRPFVPFDLKNQAKFNFVEVPLHIMDGTLRDYEKFPPEVAIKRVTSFLEKHKSGAVLSILWHNQFFTDYKYGSYSWMYEEILSYLQQSSFVITNQQEIIDEYLESRAETSGQRS